MRAVVCKEFGPPENLVVEDVEDPLPGDGEVAVDVRSVAITFPETLIIEDRYQFKATPPFIPGGEVAGVVSAVGPGVTDLSVGDDVIGGSGTGGFAERIAINTPIQGTAADMIKIAMTRIQEQFKKRNLRSRMILQVHDELVFDLYRDEKETVVPLVQETMQHAIPMKVPILVESGTGKNWLEAH